MVFKCDHEPHGLEPGATKTLIREVAKFNTAGDQCADRAVPGCGE